MAILSLESLTEPLPGAEPCGPDLDLVGDPDFMTFMAAAEGLVPATFFSGPGGGPFDRTKVDFESAYKVIARLAGRTRDLRLLALLAKFRILDRDLAGFMTALEAIAVLLDRDWEAVHPRGADGGFELRMAGVQSLDDMVPVILPLQYVPLFEHRHAGQVTFRQHLLAEGEIVPRGDEEKLDIALIKRAFSEVDIEPLVQRRDQLRTICGALARIRAAFVQNIGQGEAVSFQKLQPLAEKIRGLLDAQVVMRDPLQGEAATIEEPSEDEDSVEVQSAAGDIASLADVRAALGAIAGYFERREPSNPALLLVRQAEQLVGKSFLDALHILLPSHVDKAKVDIGRTHVFDLPLQKLAEFASIDRDGEDIVASTVAYHVATRDNALQLLKRVSAFYHAAEPSSPVPYLIERARDLTGRDFLGLLREMLPKDALKALEGK